MVFIRNCLITALCLLCMIYTQAQTVYYPSAASDVLRSTASDIAMLLQKAIRDSQYKVQSYASAIPTNGIILMYDTTITDNQACTVKSNGNGIIKFSASQDNGLNFGVYQYLQQLGFRFYQPDGSPLLGADLKASVYPNPGNGIFNCSLNGQPAIAENIIIYNNAGIRMAHFSGINKFNIGQLPAGFYIYNCL